LAPPDYDVDEHGPWMGKKLTPFICLAGDALLEPFWPMGLGLKRGWQAIMDSTYAVDNLYNRTLELDQLEVADNPELVNQDPDEYSWDMHWDNHKERCRENFENCSRVEVAEDLGKGEFQADSIVMLQWKKKYSDLERPLFLVEIDPNTRYKKRNLALNSKLKRKMLDEKDWEHPVVRRQKAILDYVEECKKNESYRGWNKLKAYGGKEIGAPAKGGYTFKAPAKKKAGEPTKMALPAAQIAAVAKQKRESLNETAVTAHQIDQHINASQQEKKNAIEAKSQAMQKSGGLSKENLHSMAYLPPEGEGVAATSEKMWARSTGADLTDKQKADLANIRMNIQMLEANIAQYKETEKAILMG